MAAARRRRWHARHVGDDVSRPNRRVLRGPGVARAFRSLTRPRGGRRPVAGASTRGRPRASAAPPRPSRSAARARAPRRRAARARRRRSAPARGSRRAPRSPGRGSAGRPCRRRGRPRAARRCRRPRTGSRRPSPRAPRARTARRSRARCTGRRPGTASGSMSSPTQPRNAPLRGRPEPPRLAAQLGLGGAGAGDHEADVAELADHRRERVERQMKALLVDEPADQQHEPLVGLGVARAQRLEVSATGSRSRGSIPFWIAVIRAGARRTRSPRGCACSASR